jgi:hypothetical protein
MEMDRRFDVSLGWRSEVANSKPEKPISKYRSPYQNKDQKPNHSQWLVDQGKKIREIVTSDGSPNRPPNGGSNWLIRAPLP